MLLFGLGCDLVWVSIWIVALLGLDFSFYFVEGRGREGGGTFESKGPHSNFFLSLIWIYYIY